MNTFIKFQFPRTQCKSCSCSVAALFKVEKARHVTEWSGTAVNEALWMKWHISAVGSSVTRGLESFSFIQVQIVLLHELAHTTPLSWRLALAWVSWQTSRALRKWKARRRQLVNRIDVTGVLDFHAFGMWHVGRVKNREIAGYNATSVPSLLFSPSPSVTLPLPLSFLFYLSLTCTLFPSIIHLLKESPRLYSSTNCPETDSRTVLSSL